MAATLPSPSPKDRNCLPRQRLTSHLPAFLPVCIAAAAITATAQPLAAFPGSAEPQRQEAADSRAPRLPAISLPQWPSPAAAAPKSRPKTEVKRPVQPAPLPPVPYAKLPNWPSLAALRQPPKQPPGRPPLPKLVVKALPVPKFLIEARPEQSTRFPPPVRTGNTPAGPQAAQERPNEAMAGAGDDVAVAGIPTASAWWRGFYWGRYKWGENSGLRAGDGSEPSSDATAGGHNAGTDGR